MELVIGLLLGIIIAISIFTAYTFHKVIQLTMKFNLINAPVPSVPAEILEENFKDSGIAGKVLDDDIYLESFKKLGFRQNGLK